jgi:hypothetical protein
VRRVLIDQENIDIIMSTIAVITAPPAQPRSIDQKDLQQVLTRPLAIGQSPDGILVSSQRDQIEVIVSGNKINVRDLSGEPRFSESKIPSTLHFFLGSSQIKSYGVNFIINVPRVEPLQWIRDNILSSQIPKRTQKTLIGGAGTLKIANGSKTWNIKLEPGEGDTINVDFNASEETQQLPDNSRLSQELQEQFLALLRFLNDLGL